FSCSGTFRDLHSFPTRRSSDLVCDGVCRSQPVYDFKFNCFRGGHGGNRSGGFSGQPAPFINEFVLVSQSACSTPGNTGPIKFWEDRKSTRLNSSHVKISYAVFC